MLYVYEELLDVEQVIGLLKPYANGTITRGYLYLLRVEHRVLLIHDAEFWVFFFLVIVCFVPVMLSSKFALGFTVRSRKKHKVVNCIYLLILRFIGRLWYERVVWFFVIAAALVMIQINPLC